MSSLALVRLLSMQNPRFKVIVNPRTCCQCTEAHCNALQNIDNGTVHCQCYLRCRRVCQCTRDLCQYETALLIPHCLYSLFSRIISSAEINVIARIYYFNVFVGYCQCHTLLSILFVTPAFDVTTGSVVNAF